jgi:hypothetical protein
VVGPPGSGKTLLITSLVEALRGHGHLVATSAPRGTDATVITMSNGGRVTVERALTAEALRTLIPQVDPRAALLLAESLDAPGTPAIELVPPGAKPTTPRTDLLALVSPQPSRDVATFGPAQTPGLADLIHSTVLNLQHEPRKRGGLLGMLRRTTRR